MTLDEFVSYLHAHEATADLAAILWVVLRGGSTSVRRRRPASS